MRKLAKPTNNAKTVFLDCVAGYTDPDLHRRLTDCADLIENASENFDKQIQVNKLYTLVKNKSTKATKLLRLFNGSVTINEMKDVYSDQFVPAGSPGRDIYDKILFNVPNQKCPYCFHRNVTTVDHYLPKAYYPLLAVAPFNLVPSCKDCNMGKQGDTPGSEVEEVLHPYYDDVEDQLWLKAQLIRTSPVTVNFFVEAPHSWNEILKERVKHHFSAFELNSLYGIEAASELIQIKHQLQDQFDQGGAAYVKDHLQRQARSRQSAFVNSWQTALYTAISNDDWFCNGGFRY